MATTIVKPDDASTEAIPPYPVRRFSVAEYEKLAEMGVLTEDDRVELLEGWIVPKMVRNAPHDGVVGIVQESLRRVLSEGWFLRIQSAIVTHDSQPEPDIAIVRGEPRRYLDHHPRPDEVALVVEVSDATVSRDRYKAGIYAAAGIPACWIINLVERQIEVMSDPTGPSEAPRYQRIVIVQADESVVLAIGGLQDVTIAAGDLLP